MKLQFSGKKITKYASVTIGIIVVSIFLFSACKSEIPERKRPEKVVQGDDLTEILKRGKLKVLAENSSTSFFNYRGKNMGFEYEILKEFCNELGIDLEVVIIDDMDQVDRQLNEGEGDLIAANYTVTNERAKEIDFSVPFLRASQVLIQRKPDGWEKMTPEEIQSKLITDPADLAGKIVNVWEHSTYFQRLMNLQQEIGDTIYIKGETGEVGTEDLIENVSEGSIEYTVVDQNVAQINSQFLDNIDISLEISVKQKIAFGLRKTSPLLKARLNQWLTRFSQKATFKYLKHKYYDLPDIASQIREISTPSAGKGRQISPFDHMFKKVAAKYNWDWRLIASISFQESRFNPNASGLGGAYGLMQFMPEIGPRYNVYPSSPPEIQIDGGVRLLKANFNLFSDVKSHEERIKFAVASYNAGASHVKDAQALADKYGLDPTLWDDNVEVMMKNLSKREFYRDEVVKNGATRGAHTVTYVKTVYQRYLKYKSQYR